MMWYVGIEEIGITVVGTPQDAMREPKYLFDTEYHLIPEGIRLRTEKFISLLRGKLSAKNRI